jgi:SPP1 gp7 family putative phage head morphogenesis protein
MEFYDEDLARQLKDNVRLFSAFKETSFKNTIESMLTENGKLLSFKEFKKKALEVSEDYNKRWLRTEYDQTVSSANMANKWKSFEANTDLYSNIRYLTVGDGRVREKHQQWDGLVLPFDHSFWNTHLPPNDWGCRCTIEQTDAPVSPQVPSGRVKKGFNTNAGKKGEVFTESPYETTLSKPEQKKAKAMAEKLKKQTE